MGKYRVFEIAKEFETTSKVIIDILGRNDIHVKNHMSSIDDSGKQLIAKTFERKADKPIVSAPQKAAEPVKPEQPKRTQAPKVNTDISKSSTGESSVRPHRYERPAEKTQRPAGHQQGQQRAVIGGSDNRGPLQGQRPTHAGQRPQSQTQNRPAGANRPYPGPKPNRVGPGQAGPSVQRSQHDRMPSDQRNQQGQRFGGKPDAAGASQIRTGASTAGSTNKNFSQQKPARPVGTDQNRKPQGKARPETKAKVQGSYATKGSRPIRNTAHVGRSNKRTGSSPKPIPEKVMDAVKPSLVQIGDSINVKAFADLIKREVSEVIKHLFMLGVMVTINQNIDFDTAVLVGSEFNVEVTALPPEEDPTEIPEVEDDPQKRLPRPPVVTVMGHVDHGKTSLLDAIRKTHVTAREAGGITQHIGAYQVNYQGKKIVFLDTPGHEAFTAMRARGAQVTDVAILVVAADDGVMPQTVEAINHAKAAKVPIVVAINKMDREGANPDHVKQQLAELELIPEDWGGETIMVPVSAHKKTGIPELLEMILLVAEMLDLKANPEIPAHGTIVEAQLDKGRGPVATVLIAKGTLRVGDTIIAGTTYGKVRAMINDRGEKVKKATPSTPVEVLGLNDVPMAGDLLDATDEKIARSVAEKRIAKKKTEEIQQQGKVSLDDIFQRIQEGELKELNIVVKADVQGTIEALKQSLANIKNEEVKVVIVHAGVGTINESDVMLASAANALIIGFNVRPDANARKAAEAEKVDIRTYRVIYDALNDVEAAIKGMLAPKFKEVIQGRVEVRQVITISKMLIAGCYVLEGKVTSSSKVRVIRDGVIVHEGEIETLRRFKDDVREVASGFECGITLDKYREVKEGDIFEVYTMEEIKP